MKSLLISAATAALLATSFAAMASDHGDSDTEYKKGAMCKMCKKHGKMMFKKMDTDGDGYITKAEHEAFTAEKFTKMDANGDGKLTKEEIKAHYKEMRSKMKERKKHEEHDHDDHDD